VPIVRVNTRAGVHLDSLGSPGNPDAAKRLDSLLTDSTYALDPIAATSRRLRFFPGDVEVNAKYRMLESRNYALTGAVVVRLPTGHQDSPNNLFDISTGDHQTDIELQVAQELMLFDRLWLNLLVRGARQQPGTRAQRVGPQSVLLIPHAALATLNWDPGDYAAIDLAPIAAVWEELRRGIYGRILDAAARSLHVSLATGLDRYRDPARRPRVSRGARCRDGAALDAPGRRDDLRDTGCGGELLRRANRHRLGWACTGGDCVPDCDADFSPAVLSSSTA